MGLFQNIKTQTGGVRWSRFHTRPSISTSVFRKSDAPQKDEGPLKMMPLMRELFPICRSITGEGFRKSLKILAREIDLNILEYPSGQQCFEWTVPDEWNIHDAYIKDARGNRIVDFRRSSLHVVNYSVPVHAIMPFKQLREHLHSLPDQPDAIPYRTSYYKRTWGFCLTHEQLLQMEKNPDAIYEVCIDSEITKGVMRIGECFLPGKTDKEILISAHNDHPCQASDGLSGALVATALAREIKKWKNRHYSYRILLLPATIGCITYIYNHKDWLKRLKGGYVLACLGDSGKFNYKKTFLGDHEIDQAMIHALRSEGVDHQVRKFWPWGGDETQYSSPGFRIPVGSLMRTPFMEFPQYHTSLDDLDYVSEEALQGSLRIYVRALRNLEMNATYRVTFAGEPKLDKHNMYVGPSGEPDLFWGTNYFFHMSDGTHSLLDIHAESGVPMETLAGIAEKALSAGLVERL